MFFMFSLLVLDTNGMYYSFVERFVKCISFSVGLEDGFDSLKTVFQTGISDTILPFLEAH